MSEISERIKSRLDRSKGLTQASLAWRSFSMDVRRRNRFKKSSQDRSIFRG